MPHARASEPSYFSDINVTPFIDVMLVLIVTIIMSLPLATHQVPIELPNGKTNSGIEEPHMLRIEKSGALMLDGRSIADAALPTTLAAIRDRPGAVLQMNTDPDTPYARFNNVLATVKRAGITKLGFVGHQQMVD
ncbi:MAG: biopolymer transporter ExbD [Sphingomonadales bacterium]|nr:MAG: biopolymer transporter ExbD [Sphingomonadales bacterium]